MVAEPMGLSFAVATAELASAVADVRGAAGRALGDRFGAGHWANEPTIRGVLFSMRDAHVLVARRSATVVGTCRLSKKRPWAMDPSYFTRAARPLYLTDMAVHPDSQGQGVGSALLDEAMQYATSLDADAIRLDAYDAEAGAGEFYERNGYEERGRVVYRGIPLIYYELLLASHV